MLLPCLLRCLQPRCGLSKLLIKIVSTYKGGNAVLKFPFHGLSTDHSERLFERSLSLITVNANLSAAC